jgi:hypothetical protein
MQVYQVLRIKMSQLSKLLDTLFRSQQAIEAYRKLKGDDDDY